MFLLLLISLMCCKGSCLLLPNFHPPYSDELIECVTDIISDYFAAQKILTYDGNKVEDNELLRAIHDLNVVAMISKRSTQKLPAPQLGYIVTSSNYSVFIDRFPRLTKEASWNPAARFLVIIKSLKEPDLRYIFDCLMTEHVNDVIVVNGTADAHLYTYNPFENFGCGKHYDDVINYGKCFEAREEQDLYPDKFITEMENCTLTVAIPHWPPYTLYPPADNRTSSPLSYGLEPYLLRLVGQMEGFTLNIIYNEDNRGAPAVSPDMEAIGPLKLLQDNEADAVLGGLLLVPSRAIAFSYIYDFLPYVDEIQFLVRRASLVPPWKNIYLEFNANVWILIILSLIFYSIIMMILLRAKDKSLVVFQLADNLVLHSCNIKCKSTVKAIFIIWVWFAYLINAFYQSSLVSLTTNPAWENQISTEADIIHHNLKPCFSEEMDQYYMESTQSDFTHTPVPTCHDAIDSVTTVMNSNEYYTIFLHRFYEYHRHDFFDNYGNSYIYSLKKPYSKVIYCMYFYKGFPLMADIRLSALLLREMGLVDKALSDIYYVNIINHHFHAKGFDPRFAVPWRLYIFGCTAAAITLLVEILSVQKY